MEGRGHRLGTDLFVERVHAAPVVVGGCVGFEHAFAFICRGCIKSSHIGAGDSFGGLEVGHGLAS